ncbi:hypothetical protein I315_04382 [Cryptococcus gattii Ru294]|nr:hypothetical protein I315_04382 [Cryptococcus gattii Ru294]
MSALGRVGLTASSHQLRPRKAMSPVFELNL